MASARDILVKSRHTLLRWPSLWLPPIGINAFQGMAGVPMTSVAAQIAVAVTSYLAAFIVGAGWLAMIGRGLAGERPRFADFQAGVNHHWLGILTGNVVFFVLLGGLVAAIAAWGDQHYGIKALADWYDHISRLSGAELERAIEPAQLPAAIRGWLMLFGLGLGGAALLSFLLLFWQPLVVLAERPWWKAWAGSVRLVFRRFRLAFGLAVLHAVLLFASLTVASSRSAIFAVVGLTMLLFVSIYFKIAYAEVVVDAVGLRPEAPASETDTPRP